MNAQKATNEWKCICVPDSLFNKDAFKFFTREYRRAPWEPWVSKEMGHYAAWQAWNQEGVGFREAFWALATESDCDLRKIEGMTPWSIDELKLIQP